MRKRPFGATVIFFVVNLFERFTRWLSVFLLTDSLFLILTLYPPNFPQIIKYKGVTSILYENKDLASKISTLN